MSDSQEQTLPTEAENPTTADGAAAQPADASQEQGQVVTQTMLDTAQAQAQEYLEGWQRARAEFANYKKRVEREMKDSQSNGSATVLKSVLPVIDDFERAMTRVPDTLTDDPWVSGVGMILRKLNKVLDDYGVEIIDPTGETFDPSRHEAIGKDEPTENVKAGQITMTVQKGYILGDRVLRPALVRVAE